MMEVVFITIPISLVIIGVALWAFVWSVRHDQFEDLEKEAYAILFDDEESEQENKQKHRDEGAPT